MKKNMKKFISVVLSALMAVAIFPASTMAAVEINPSMEGNYVINEDFADSTLDSNIGDLPSGSEVTSDGVLKIKSGNVTFNMDSASTWNTLKCVSMKLKKDDKNGIVSISNPSGHLNAYWHQNNEIKTWKSINDDGINVLKTITAETGEWITLKMLFNPSVQEYLVIIEEGDKIYTFLESLKDYNKIGTDKTLKISVGGASQGYIYIDDLKVYNANEADVPAETAILWDAAALESALPESTENNLTLPTTGKYGSTITWSSSNTAVIANNGTVVRQSINTDVTLTATIEKGGSKKTQAYKVTVLKNYIVPVTGGFGYEESFSNSSSINSNITLPASGREITADGTLKLTKTDAGSSSSSAISAKFKVAAASNWTALKCISMKLKKTNNSGVVILQNSSASFQMYWHAGNVIKATNSSLSDVATITATTDDWINLKVIMNPALKKYYLQIDDGAKTYTLDSLSSYGGTSVINGYDFLNILIDKYSGPCDLYIDDLKVYDVEEVSVPAATAFLWDKEILKDVIPAKIEKDLPQASTYGSVINWSANVPGIVASNGKVTKPEEDTQITLTATITNANGETATATANAVVKKAVVVPKGDYIINEDFTAPFEGSWTNEKITLTGATVADGKLKLSSTNNKASLRFADSTGWTDLIGYKFDITKSAVSQVVQFTTGGIAMQFYWHSNGALVINEGGTVNWGSGSLDATGTITVTGLINPVLDNYSLIIEDSKGTHFIKSWDNIPNFYVKNATALDVIYQSGNGDITVDNVQLFKVVENSVPEATAVLWDKEILESVIPANIEADLSSVGTYGSAISWSANADGIIATDGTVTLPSVDTEVTLTASITNGDATLQTATLSRMVKTADFKYGKVAYSGTGYSNGALKTGTVTVTYPVTKVNATVNSVVVMSAAYKIEGGKTLLKAFDICPVSFEEGNTQTATLELAIEDGCFIKTFIVDSLTTLKSLGSPIVIGQ